MKTLVCSCCGYLFRGEQDWNHDTGFGICDDCKQEQVDDFVESWSKVLLEHLDADRQKKFNDLSEDAKFTLICSLIEKGALVYRFPFDKEEAKLE